MDIQEFYDSIDENYENESSRMMRNQKVVEIISYILTD